MFVKCPGDPGTGDPGAPGEPRRKLTGRGGARGGGGAGAARTWDSWRGARRRRSDESGQGRREPEGKGASGPSLEDSGLQAEPAFPHSSAPPPEPVTSRPGCLSPTQAPATHLPRPGPPAEEVASPRAPRQASGVSAGVQASRRGRPRPTTPAEGSDFYLGEHFTSFLQKRGEPLPRSLKLGTSRSSVRGRRQTHANGTRAPSRPAPPRTRLTHPKVLMKPLTEPSAYRETMSPM